MIETKKDLTTTLLKDFIYKIPQLVRERPYLLIELNRLNIEKKVSNISLPVYTYKDSWNKRCVFFRFVVPRKGLFFSAGKDVPSPEVFTNTIINSTDLFIGFQKTQPIKAPIEAFILLSFISILQTYYDREIR